jgi:hypothetical protein
MSSPVNLLDSLVMTTLPTVERSAQILSKSQRARPQRTDLHSIYVTSDSARALGKNPEAVGRTLQKSVANVLNGPEDSLERLAFERDPQRITEYAGIYRPKLQGVPDSLLKRMAIQDDLVAAIVHTRSNHIAQFGRQQEDRHQKGFKIVVNRGVEEKLDPTQKSALQERITRAEKLVSTCGHTNGWSEQEKCSFPEFLYMSTRNVCVVGRMATEIVWTPDPDAPNDDSKRKFHSFRPTDAGTIYFAAPYHEVNQQVREMALRLMENLKNEKLKKEGFENEEYAWVQVFEGRPLQAFGAQEMLVHSPYSVTDIEQMGYPVTPLDTALSAVTTHINITHHNRLYFQTGRAARGMLIIKSADIDPDIVQGVKQQFNASINSVQNAWRMPVFGIGPEDELTWAAIDSSGGRDMEFQYLADANARTLLSAFQMSPEELPGYQHLSRGTNNQSLSESNEEYKLTAARDVGIRPLMASIEDFLNSSILPLIDEHLSKVAKLKLVGLDADTEEKESVRIQQDMGVWMTFNDIRLKLEKKPLPKHLAADIPLNPTYFQYLQMFVPFGQILEDFLGIQGASKDPQYAFFMNPFWQQQQQMVQQQQAMQQQAAAQGGAPGGGQPPSGGGGQPSGGQPQPSPDQASSPGQDTGDLSTGVDQLLSIVSKSENLLSKGEKNMPPSKRRLRERTIAANKAIMDAFARDMDHRVRRITDSIEPPKKG